MKKVRNTATVSGYKGVHLNRNKKTNPWRARIDLANGNKYITISLGEYATPNEAYNARKKYLMSLI